MKDEVHIYMYINIITSHVSSTFLSGSKHKTMLEARSGAGPIKAYPRPGAKLKSSSSSSTVKGSGLQNKTFHCQICDVHVNSEIQLKQVEAPSRSTHLYINRDV